MKRKYNVQIGDKARDRVSGFTGTVTCRKEHLFGNMQFVLENFNEAGDKSGEAYAYDWQQLELVIENSMPVTECVNPGDVELGDEVEDRITCHVGVVTSVWYWMNGCIEALVEGEDVDGKEIVRRNSVHRFEVLEKGRIKPVTKKAKEQVARKTGGPSMRLTRESLK